MTSADGSQSPSPVIHLARSRDIKCRVNKPVFVIQRTPRHAEPLACIVFALMQSPAPAAMFDLVLLSIWVFVCILTSLAASCAGQHWMVEAGGLAERGKNMGHQQRAGVQASVAPSTGPSHFDGPGNVSAGDSRSAAPATSLKQSPTPAPPLQSPAPAPASVVVY